ncbi:MAG: cytochrome C oxidase subunit IV family protein [Xanthobacteraceae bacterium]
MSDARDTGERERSRKHRSYLWDLGGALLFSLLSLGLSTALRRRSSEVAAIGNARDRYDEYRRDLHSYIWGVGLALPLTVVPFALVYWAAMPRFWLLFAIGGFALTQIVVHFRFFLHIDPPRQKVDDLQLILFSGLILFVMAGGTIWIMANLAMRMM